MLNVSRPGCEEDGEVEGEEGYGSSLLEDRLPHHALEYPARLPAPPRSPAPASPAQEQVSCITASSYSL